MQNILYFLVSVTVLQSHHVLCNDDALPVEVNIIGGLERLDEALKTPFLMVNDLLVSIEEFLEVPLTAENFKIGESLAQTLREGRPVLITTRPELDPTTFFNKQLIERELQSEKSPEIKATSSAIVANIKQSVLTNEKGSVTLILGEPSSGKTVTIDKIRYDFSEPTETSTHWMIPIEAADFANSVPNGEEIGMGSFVNKYVPGGYQDLFRTILNVNPKKIMIFIDGINPSDATATQMYSLMKQFHDYGVGVVVTGNEYIRRRLAALGVEPTNVWTLNELTFNEAKQFVTNIWNDVFAQSRTDPQSRATALSRIDDWCTAFTSFLYETPLSKQPEMLKQLIYAFHERWNNYGEYFTSPKFSPLKLNTMKYEKINKKAVYDSYVESIRTTRPHDNIYTTEYGVVALTKIMNRLGNTVHFGSLSVSAASGLLRNIQDFRAYEEQRNHQDNPVGPSTYDEKAEMYLHENAAHTIFTRPIENNKVQFIHQEFEYYFAAYYITSMLKTTNVQEKFFIRYLLESPKYGRLLELVDGMQLWVKLQSQGYTNKIVPLGVQHRNRIFDNLLSSGFDNLFDRCIVEYPVEDRIRVMTEYFQNEGLLAKQYSRTFGMIVSEEQMKSIDWTRDQIVRPDIYQRTRLELVVDQDLERIMEFIIFRNIDTGLTGPGFAKLLYYAATKPKPDLIKFTRLEHVCIMRGINIDYNILMYHVLNTVAETGLEMVKYLQNKITNPRQINENGRTLLHAAMKWNDPNIVNHVVTRFGIPLGTQNQLDPGLFRIAIDCNPSPRFTPIGFWKKMNFLFGKKVQFPIAELIHDANDARNYKITPQDYRSPWLRFILGHESIKLQGNTFDAREMTVSLYQSSNPGLERDLDVALYTPPAEWGLSDNAKSLRRNFLIKSLQKESGVVIVSEFLINYRGHHELPISEREFYRKTILKALEYDKEVLTNEMKLRMFYTMNENVGSANDIQDVEYFAHNGLLDPFEYNINDLMLSALEYRPNPRISHGDTTIESVLTRTKAQLYTAAVSTRTIEEAIEKIRITDELNSSADSGVLSCGTID